MKRLILILFIGTTYLMAFSFIYAQERTNIKKNNLGVGVTISDIKELFQFISSDVGIAPTIFIPINISPTFRIEPEFGLYMSTLESNDESDKLKLGNLNLGIGFFPMINKKNIKIYYGPRVGLIYSSSNEYYNDTKSEISGIGFYIAPVVGGEFYFAKHFSLGGEGQLKYSYSSLKEDDDEKGSSLILSTRTLVFIRFYF